MSETRTAVMYGGPQDGLKTEIEVDGDISRWWHKEPNGQFSVYVRRDPLEKILAQHRANPVAYDYATTVEDLEGVKKHGAEEARDRPDPS